MRAARVNRARAVIEQRLRGLDQRPGRVDQIVDHQTSPPVDVAYDVHNFRDVHLHAPFVDNRQRRVHLLCEKPRPFHAACVRRYHRKVRQAQLLEVIHQHRRCEQMVNRNIEKPLQLRRMRIDHQRPVRTRRGQQVRHQLRRNRDPRLVLAILARIAVVRNHRRNTPRRSALQRIQHQQQLHQMHVHRMASRLHDEDISPTHILLNLYIRLAIGKARQHRLAARQPEEVAHFITERLICRSTKNLELVVHSGTLWFAFRLFVRHRLFFRFFSGCCCCGHSSCLRC